MVYFKLDYLLMINGHHIYVSFDYGFYYQKDCKQQRQLKYIFNVPTLILSDQIGFPQFLIHEVYQLSTIDFEGGKNKIRFFS